MPAKKAAITVNRPREEVERLWQGAPATFKTAPGDRGTEIYVEVQEGKLRGRGERAKAMDALRHFKQRIETGEVARSEGTPEGERAERKLKQHPAQPLTADELEKAGIA
jgi:hypothetical protein